jgi:hypothetical protein
LISGYQYPPLLNVVSAYCHHLVEQSVLLTTPVTPGFASVEDQERTDTKELQLVVPPQ